MFFPDVSTQITYSPQCLIALIALTRFLAELSLHANKDSLALVKSFARVRFSFNCINFHFRVTFRGVNDLTCLRRKSYVQNALN